MAEFRRYAIYVVPEGDLYPLGASWLGWDSIHGRAVPHPHIDRIADPVDALTRRPRKYGMHGTIKPPFALAEAVDAATLEKALAEFCAKQAPVTVPELSIRSMGRFVAIVPTAPCPALNALASACVRNLDPFRAPMTEERLAKRRKGRLNPLQEEMLQRWGYPYVMDAFRFHMTLTGRVQGAENVASVLTTHFAETLAQPINVTSLCLMGEDFDGYFHLIRRFALSG